MRDAFVRQLTQGAERDSRIMLMAGDIGFGVLTDFAQRFPQQFLNAGVAEQNMTGVACGLGLGGRVVFTYSLANFNTLRCLEQIRNDVCYHNANVKFVSVGGGFSYGQLGMSHYATEDIAILRTLPNMRVIVPSGIWESAEATRALCLDPGPAYLRLDKAVANSEPRPGERFVLGVARVLRPGFDVAIIAAGSIVVEALTAADDLRQLGVGCRVISMHSIKPLDSDVIFAAARETCGIVTLEEHTIVGGLGTAVAEVCMEAGVVPGFFIRMGLRDVYASIVGDQNFLRAHFRIDAASIKQRITDALGLEMLGRTADVSSR